MITAAMPSRAFIHCPMIRTFFAALFARPLSPLLPAVEPTTGGSMTSQPKTDADKGSHGIGRACDAFGSASPDS